MENNSKKSRQQDPVQDNPKRGRGRPKGTKNATKRIDHDINKQVKPGFNAHCLRYTRMLSDLPKINYNDIDQVKARINEFFDISDLFDMKPAVAALALSLGIDRTTLFNWLTGKTETIKNKECFDTIKKAYNAINTQYEMYMNNGSINPVAGIFLMKNNLGYKDTTDHVITANQDNNIALTDITERAGLLEE